MFQTTNQFIITCFWSFFPRLILDAVGFNMFQLLPSFGRRCHHHQIASFSAFSWWKGHPNLSKSCNLPQHSLPIFGTNAGIVKLVRDLQARKARSPIWVTDCGIIKTPQRAAASEGNIVNSSHRLWDGQTCQRGYSQRKHFQFESQTLGWSNLSKSCSQRKHFQFESQTLGWSNLSKSCNQRKHFQFESQTVGWSNLSKTCSHEKHDLQFESQTVGWSSLSKTCSHEKHFQSQTLGWSNWAVPHWCWPCHGTSQFSMQ